jgi:hypothetical protein
MVKTNNMNNSKFEWVAKIIETSTNDFHFTAVDRLIELFYEIEKDEALTHELRVLRNNKWNEIHHILV